MSVLTSPSLCARFLAVTQFKQAKRKPVVASGAAATVVKDVESPAVADAAATTPAAVARPTFARDGVIVTAIAVSRRTV
jgi:hypothetical protein